MDLTTISAIITSVTSATDIAKLLKESGFSLEKAEAKLKLAELIDALANVKMQVADVRILLLEKDEEIRKLQDEMKVKGNMVFESPHYWLDNGEEKEGPFCQACYDNMNKLVRLQCYKSGLWNCRVCGSNFVDKDFHG